MPQSYEFTAAQNRKFMQLYRWVAIFAVVFSLSGVFTLINGTIQMMGPQGMEAWPVVAFGIIRGAYGLLFLLPLSHIKKINDTRGHDIPEVMKVLRGFSQAFYLGIYVAAVHLLVAGWRFHSLLGTGG